jgi:hypothetical protein
MSTQKIKRLITIIFYLLKPKRIIFNPGTENPVLSEKAKQNNIETIEACTLVLLSIGHY